MQLVPAKRIYASDHAIHFGRVHGDRFLGCKRKSCKDQPNDRILGMQSSLCSTLQIQLQKASDNTSFVSGMQLPHEHRNINMSVAGSKLLQCSVCDIHAAWVFQRHIWQKGDNLPISNFTDRFALKLLPSLRRGSNKDARVQPILILSSVTSMIFIVGFGASTTYTMAILMRLAGGLCNFTFGCACLHLSVPCQICARCKKQHAVLSSRP